MHASHFAWQFAQLQFAMALGAVVGFLLLHLISAGSSFALIYYPGAYLYTVGDIFFLTVPVIVWMVFRGDTWRHGLQMAVAMLVPVVAIVVVGELTGYAYRPWLITAGYPAMSLGMLIYLLYRTRQRVVESRVALAAVTITISSRQTGNFVGCRPKTTRWGGD